MKTLAVRARVSVRTPTREAVRPGPERLPLCPANCRPGHVRRTGTEDDRHKPGIPCPEQTVPSLEVRPLPASLHPAQSLRKSLDCVSVLGSLVQVPNLFQSPFKNLIQKFRPQRLPRGGFGRDGKTGKGLKVNKAGKKQLLSAARCTEAPVPTHPQLPHIGQGLSSGCSIAVDGRPADGRGPGEFRGDVTGGV